MTELADDNYSYPSSDDEFLPSYRQEEIQRYRKDINFILDDIMQAHYPVGQEEIDLHKEISTTYEVDAAKRLYDLVSAKTPYKRVQGVFDQFRILLMDLLGLSKKISAMDRIHKQQNDGMANDLKRSFYEEYFVTIEDVIDVISQIQRMAIFFEYFIPENGLSLKDIFDGNNLKELYNRINTVMMTWDPTKSNEQRTDQDYQRTLEDIRKYIPHSTATSNTQEPNIYRVIFDWKKLEKRLKKYYPTSILWYSKKYYFNYFHELIVSLREYQKYLHEGTIESLYEDSNSNGNKVKRGSKKRRIIRHLKRKNPFKLNYQREFTAM